MSSEDTKTENIHFTPGVKMDVSFTFEGKQGSYLVSKEYLGGGSFGSVWKGYRKSDMEPVAVKIIQPKMGLSLLMKKLIESEIKVLEKLSQFPKCIPQIVCIYDWGKDKLGRYILVMEYLSGGDLSQVDRKDLPNALLELAQGLQILQTHGIIHRDIKPENILRNNQGQIKLVDLGLGCSIDRDPDLNDCDGSAGTPGYLDPRFRLPEPYSIATADFKSDIFSLGQTFYTLLTGESPPFYSSELSKAKAQHRKALLELIDQDGVPDWFLDMIGRMITPETGDPRPTPEEILQAAQGVSSPAQGVSSPAQGVSSPAQGVFVSYKKEEVKELPSRRKEPELNLPDLLARQALQQEQTDFDMDIPRSTVDSYLRIAQQGVEERLRLRVTPSDLEKARKILVGKRVI